jgi:hypothetical protein
MITALLSLVLAVVAPTVSIQPGALDQGPHVAGPHVEGRVLHDGTMRMAFRAPRVTFLGVSGDRYVMHLSRADGSNARVMWIRADESQRVLRRGLDVSEVLLSQDGKHVVTTPSFTRDSTTVRVLSATSGRVLNTRTFRGSVSVLDADEGRAVMGAWSPNRTFWWTFDGTDDTKRINGRVGYLADIRADRVASFTKDPYLDGCSILTDLRNNRLSKSCKERITAVSPSGSRVATIHILSDGLGPNSVTLRRAAGGALATYEAPYYFGRIGFEDDTSLLLDTYGQRRWATVRCAVDDCERASKLRKTPRY